MSWLEHFICPACLRLRVSPIHWFTRMIGFCPGRKYFW